MKHKLIGLDIGGTKCAVISGVCEDANPSQKTIEITNKISFPTATDKGLEQTLENIYQGIEDTLKANQWDAKDVSAIGISCGGPLDSKQGIVMSPPNLPGWDNVPIVKLLEDKFNIPASIQNDANACALAEWQFGAGKGYNNVVFLTFGTGMGSGIILDGRLIDGTNGNAGEVGHIRLESTGPVGYGKAGSFEGFCSGNGIAQLGKTFAMEKFQRGQKTAYAASLKDLENVTAKTIADAARQGDATAIKVYNTSGLYLGKALSIIIDILNPEVIVIGSIYARCQDLLEPQMRKSLSEESLDISEKVCKIVPAGLGESIGDIAALSVGAYKI